MTPQERQLISELFDRLATLERQPRDSDAERAIAEGFERAPHAAYALVQTVLVQDEALKRANARIEELQAASGETQQGGGFLETMRNSMFGRDTPRGSVPSVRAGGGEGSSGVWNTGARPEQPGWGGGGRPGGEPQYAPPPPPSGGGGSFLGTAAASAAGVIGGAMLLNGIRSMFGPSHGGSASAFDPGLSGRTPWGGDASGSDLAREAGLGDVGGSRTAAYEDDTQRTGLFGGDDDGQADDGQVEDADYAGGDFDDDGGFDGGEDSA
jgi:hypothetical protein